MKRGTYMAFALAALASICCLYYVPGITATKGATAIRYTSDRFAMAEVNWQTIVNNGFTMPNSDNKYSSYGQPSVNENGLVVFRARSTGGQRQTGIYARLFPKGNVFEIADLTTFVPYPNNLESTFREFPAVPRIAASNDLIAFSGIHKPVYRYLLPDGTETRVGTTGIYVRSPNGLLINGTSKIGVAPGFENHAVPGTIPLIGFDVYPGAPAITDSGKIVFKGNYTKDGIGQTGIFYRDLFDVPEGGTQSVEMIASSETEIPGMPPSFKSFTFDSTSPPSVAGESVVFLGLDNEDDPHYGGIYMAPISRQQNLQLLVGIGEAIPDLGGQAMTRLGEALSFDGRFIAFWGAWGTETKTVRLFCPEDGEANVIEYCKGQDPNSVFDPRTERWYQDKHVPLNQGFFVYDMALRYTYLAAQTTSEFDDLLFWVYSGRPPGVGGDSKELVEEESGEEPPRWRSSGFVTVADEVVVFKARHAAQTKTGEYVDIVDGIYLKNAVNRMPIEALVETGMSSDLLDPSIPTGILPITGLGIERDGLRGARLTITAAMADEDNSWGGIYYARIPRVNSVISSPVKKVR